MLQKNLTDYEPHFSKLNFVRQSNVSCNKKPSCR